ncbi:MAG: type II toxin-antitoxin system YoeB family toxin, partial [Holosporales bacterium]|nr:type II toxin-antitoxin system YoeB family toxin [Holosporales bacterium]
MKVIFTEEGFSEYVSWQLENKKTIERINKLIKSIQREGLVNGLG